MKTMLTLKKKSRLSLFSDKQFWGQICSCSPAAERVLTLAALRVVSTQAKKARLTLVAAWPLHVALATALTSHHAEGRVRVAVAHPSILRTVRVAVTRCGTYRSQ